MPDRPAPRYSLVVMTFDRPAALRRCLTSIAQLDWRGAPPEVIVIDDGSQPPARAEAEVFANALDIVYAHAPNGGVAVARNRGLALARGEFVAFLADDYRLPSDYLTRVDEFFTARPDAQVVSFSVRPGGRGWLRSVQALYLQLALAQQFATAPDDAGVVASTALPASRAAVFRRAVFERVGGFDETLRVGEDGDLGCRLAALGIPIHLFLRHFVEHDEPPGARGYFRQRLRYGRSFVRVLGGEPARGTLERLAFAGVPVCAARKLRDWWRVAGRCGVRRRYVVRSPWLFAFLAAFYLGALLELRHPEGAAR